MTSSTCRPDSLKHQSGVTLIEVLVTMLVLAIGLLGLAGLQAQGLQSNNRAYMRSQAAILAYDMADRMRGNLSNYLNDYANIDGTEADPGCINTAPVCTAAQIAQYDGWAWSTAARAALPLAQVAVCRDSDPTSAACDGAGNQMKITIVWDDDRSGAVDANDPIFTLSFQP